MIMRTKLIVLALLLLTPIVGAQEAVTLTTPIVKPSTSACSLDTLLLDVKGARIVASLTCNNGDQVTKQYDSFTTPTGATLLHSLNIGNFSVNSLIKAVYTRLITDGVITGTVTGVAQ